MSGNLRERDPDTGLLFYRARWYDPQQGRFLSEDPAGLAGGRTNAYSYTNGNPINARDPSGQIINLVTPAIGLGVGAVVGASATALISLYRTGHLPTLAQVANVYAVIVNKAGNLVTAFPGFPGRP
ncbi:MAG TPA: RHS repeat-associated core domain-containing protein [Candidatus Angelobacter sp.]|nr:RHS repeat-associated core domain-containing protein [Candidatus Angelobacter sp.]